VGYLGARSLEILILFLVLYNFLMLIDKNFTDLLSYRACLEHWGIGPLQLKILKSYPDRSFISWIVSFVVIAGLLFITNIIVNKVNELASNLISIGGVKGGNADDGKQSRSFIAGGGLAGAAWSALRTAAGTAYSAGASGGRYALQGLTAAARSSGIADSWNRLGDKIGVRGIRTRLRDSIIDAQLDKFSAEARAAGKTGHAADSYARGKAFEALTKEMQKDPNKMALYGVDNTNILKRFDQKLVGNALQKFMLDKMKKIKSGKDGEIPLGYDAMKERMLKEANEWADKNMTNGREAIKGYLEGGFKNLFGDDIIKRNFELSSSEAAKLFAGKTDAQNKYLKYLRENELRNRGKKDYKPGIWSDATRDPEKIRENFLRKLRKREEEKAQWDKIRSKEWHPSKKWSQSLKKAIIFSGQSLKDAIGFQVKKPWRELTSSTSNLQAYKDQRDERLALEKEMMSADAERKAVLQRAIEAREKAMLELAAKDAEVAKLREKDAIDALARAKSMLEKEAAKIQEESKKVDDTVKAIDKILDDKAKSDADKKAEIRTKLEADGLIPTGLKVEFGAKISDVLLVAPDIGLKAGNILLGVPDSRKKEFNEAQVKDLEIRLTQENSKLKISKMNQKLKEFEIQQLEKLDPKDAGLDRLRTELEDLKKEVNKFESNVTDFEKQKVVLSIAS
jgi:hypothetical protein